MSTNFRNYSNQLPKGDFKEIRNGVFINKDAEIYGYNKKGYYRIYPYLNQIKQSDKVKYSWKGGGYYKFHYNGHMYNVHRLLAEAWLPGYFEGAIVDHINNNTTDNRLENLQWLTQRENIQKAQDSMTEEQRKEYKKKYSEAVKKAHAEGKYKKHLEKLASNKRGKYDE